MNAGASREPAERKPKSREIFDYDAVNGSDPSGQEEPYEEEDPSEEDEERRSNPVLVILLTIVIVALLAAIGFVLFRYFLPARNQQDETLPTESQASDTTEASIPTVPCTGISLTSGMPTLSQEGQFWLLHVVVMPEDTTDTLTYASMDETIATVNEEGRVTAVSQGETTIVVTCGSQRIECPVTVNYTVEETTQPATDETQPAEETQPEEETQAPTDAAPAAPDVVLKLKKTDITFGRSGVYVDLELDCELTVDQVEWSSANPNVATVKDGAVTAVGPGITTITVKYGDQTVTCIVRCNF